VGPFFFGWKSTQSGVGIDQELPAFLRGGGIHTFELGVFDFKIPIWDFAMSCIIKVLTTMNMCHLFDFWRIQLLTTQLKTLVP
jgi:hypothetical protein